jgi:hypothetical protein
MEVTRQKNKHETPTKIPLSKYVHLNRRGKPATHSWKSRMVKNNTAPFKWVLEDDNTYVILNHTEDVHTN